MAILTSRVVVLLEAPSSSLFLHFGFRYCKTDGRRWSPLVSRLQDTCAREPRLGNVHEALIGDLAGRLPTEEFVHALPDEGSLTETLPALLCAVGDSYDGR